MNWLVNSWYRPCALRWLLLPLTFIYQTICYLRKQAYQHHFLRHYKLPVPVIIVGNISVGGTGKTPFVIWLVEQLQAAGFRPGVLSRGYGGKSHHYPLAVTNDSNATQVGDEPLLIAHRTNCPVIVDPKRSRAGQYLLKNTSCDVIVSDDGLQHYALQRDIEIVLVDGQRGFGNGLCLPAGPLREPVSRIEQADLVIYHAKADDDEQHHMILELADCINLLTGQRMMLGEFAGRDVHAIAGIGHPQRFFDTLRANGLIVHTHPFGDHHLYQPSDLNFAEPFPILMTEKDAVKCIPFANDNIWTIPVNARLTAKVWPQIQNHLKRLDNG